MHCYYRQVTARLIISTSSHKQNDHLFEIENAQISIYLLFLCCLQLVNSYKMKGILYTSNIFKVCRFFKKRKSFFNVRSAYENSAIQIKKKAVFRILSFMESQKNVIIKCFPLAGTIFLTIRAFWPLFRFVKHLYSGWYGDH